MSRLEFETPEDVHLGFTRAGPGSRIGAGIVDMTIISVLIVAALGVLVAADAIAFSLRAVVEGSVFDELSAFAVALIIGVVFGLNLGYFIVAEWLLDGQSPGKRVLGLRVVKDGGYSLTWSASIVRNVARVVDMLPGPYLVGILSMLLTRDGKRLGDFIAGTVVIRHERVTAPKVPFSGERYSTLVERKFTFTRQHVSTAGEDAYTILDSFFERISALPDEQKNTLTQNLTKRFSEALDMPVAPGLEERFLKELYLAARERLDAGL